MSTVKDDRIRALAIGFNGFVSGFISLVILSGKGNWFLGFVLAGELATTIYFLLRIGKQ